MFLLYFLLALVVIIPFQARGEVTRIEVLSRGPWLDGKAMGNAGSYEKLRGRVYYAVDPTKAQNQRVADIGLAPRNSDGLVEFSGDFVLVRPVDPAKARSTVILEIPNRGLTQENRSFFTTAKYNSSFQAWRASSWTTHSCLSRDLV